MVVFAWAWHTFGPSSSSSTVRSAKAVKEMGIGLGQNDSAVALDNQEISSFQNEIQSNQIEAVEFNALPDIEDNPGALAGSSTYRSIMEKAQNLEMVLGQLPSLDHQRKEIQTLLTEISSIRRNHSRLAEGEELSLNLLTTSLDFVTDSGPIDQSKCEDQKQQFLFEFSPREQEEFQDSATALAFQFLQHICGDLTARAN
jgi:hypothetical protein